jgi:hypothetical protein
VASIWITARSLLRHGWKGAVVLTLLAGVAAGAVLTAVAGARRTDSAYPRLVDATRSGDVQVAPSFGRIDVEKVAALPQVERSGRLLAFYMPRRSESGLLELENMPGAQASADGHLYYDIEQPHIIDGRLPRRDRADEAVVNKVMADRFRLRVGSTYRSVLVDFPSLEEFAASGRPPSELDLDALETPLEFRIVGISRGQAELIPAEGAAIDSVMLLGPAFAARYAEQASVSGLVVQLGNPERDIEPFKARVRALFPGAFIEFPSTEGRLETVGRSVRPYSVALNAFAIVFGIAAFLVLGQILARQVALDSADAPTLRAVGMVPAHVFFAVLARGAVVAVGGAALAVAVAVVASPIFPIGPAGLAEPDPGVRVDGTALLVGALVVALVLTGRAAMTAWRIALAADAPAGDEMTARARPSEVAGRLARAGIPPAPAIGVRFALQGAGPVGPVTTLVGLVTAVAAVMAALGFGASLDRVTGTPRLYGWNWDVLLEGYSGTTQAIDAQAQSDRDLVAKTSGSRTAIRFEGKDVVTYAFEHGQGKLRPTLIEGRLPRTAGEAAFGESFLDDLDASVGDAVTTSRGERFQVVGKVVLPALSLGQTVGLAEGAVVTPDGLQRVAPVLPSFIAADLAPGARVSDIRTRYDKQAAVSVPHPPPELQSYERVDNVPVILAAALGVLGGGILSHALITSIRRRRREFAVLKTVGFVRPQVGVAVACEATTLIALGLLIGLPLGVAAGRWAWALFADQLGVVVDPVVSFPYGLMIVAAVALLLANVVAGPPGRSAARTRPAVVLRSE